MCPACAMHRHAAGALDSIAVGTTASRWLCHTAAACPSIFIASVCSAGSTAAAFCADAQAAARSARLAGTCAASPHLSGPQQDVHGTLCASASRHPCASQASAAASPRLLSGAVPPAACQHFRACPSPGCRLARLLWLPKMPLKQCWMSLGLIYQSALYATRQQQYGDERVSQPRCSLLGVQGSRPWQPPRPPPRARQTPLSAMPGRPAFSASPPVRPVSLGCPQTPADSMQICPAPSASGTEGLKCPALTCRTLHAA